MWGLGGRRLLLLSIPPFLLALQLLLILVGSGPPGAARDRDGAVAFEVLSIEPERSAQRRGASVQRPAREEEAGRVYVDENEMHERQIGPMELEVQRWAADTPSFAAEVNRFIAYINTPQLNCSRVSSPERTLEATSRWLLCADGWLLPAADSLCVAYSFSMDGGDKDFLETVSRLGCEIHCFDPSSSDASGGCPGNSLASNCGDRGRVSRHKMWLEWRAQRKRGRKARSDLGRVSQTLANIMAALGHHTVRGAPSRDASAVTHAQEKGKKWRENTTKQTYRGDFHPSIPRKLFYFDVAIATGLCAISGCYSNSVRESHMGFNFILLPQEGATHLQFDTEIYVDFLYADLLGAEWRVFQNWIEARTLQHVRHLVATVHLHWAGFEVGGSDEEVLRYWYSVLWGLQASGLKLVHSSAGESHIVLKQAVANAHSSYTLSWVNMWH